MASDHELEVHRTLHESQRQHVYFLLGAAGAAIALAVNQTHTAAISWSQLPLAVAVACWACSFYAGCRNRSWVGSGLNTNGAIFDVRSGRHPVSGIHPQAIAVGLETLHGIFEEQSAHANSTYHLQFRFLVAGACFYVLWHILEMYLRLGA